ncbi:hypothetical protein D3C84_945880 [compost metagenome]
MVRRDAMSGDSSSINTSPWATVWPSRTFTCLTRAATGACKALARPASSMAGTSTALRQGNSSTSSNASKTRQLRSIRPP